MTMWGATLGRGDRTRFRLWAPGAREVSLEVTGNSVELLGHEGWHEVEAYAAAGTHYRYRVDGVAVPDPASRAQAGGPHDPSIVVDPRRYEWRNPDWCGRPWREAIVYELHAGVLGGFAGVAERLEEIASLGFTAVELMPVAAFPGTRNWGYDGVLPYAPAASYGAPDDLKALVDRAHGLGLMVLLDVVYNHFGPDGNYLPNYAPAFFDEAKHTPWGAAIAFEREEVARFFIDNAVMWLDEYRFDGLRMDAVHAIRDNRFLDRLASEVRAAVPNRHVHLILENENNDAERLERGYDAQWNDDFHNIVHVLLTGEDHAYYRDFAERPAERLARVLEQGFDYQGERSPNLGEPRGTPSGHLPPTRFVTFLQNHDQAGNRAMGERLTTLVEPAALRAAMGLLLLSPQIPLLFMGEEVGSRSPFLFFTDFHDELADAVREGRRKEFAGFPSFADPEARERIPDPNALATFETSWPEPGPDAGEWRSLVSELIALRQRLIVPRLDRCRSLSAEAIGDRAVVARWTLGEAVLTIALNLGEAVTADVPASDPLFALGAPLDPNSVAAWIEETA